MGQRSQIYVIAKKNNKYYLTANYYQWNYGERMISRVRGVLQNMLDEFIKYDWLLTTENTKLRRIMDVNWDMHDIVLSADIVEEFADGYEEYWKTEGRTYSDDFFEFCFSGQDNNNGQAYIYVDLDLDKKVKIGFTQYTFDEEAKMLNADEYLTKDLANENEEMWKEHMFNSEYYDDNDIGYTERNVEYIEQNSELLSKNELLDILKSISIEYERLYKTNI